MKRPISSVLTVLGKDQPGIIAAVTGVLYENGCNLEDLTMTVLEQEFTMMVIVSLSPRQKVKTERAFKKLQARSGLTFFWKDLTGRTATKSLKGSAKRYEKVLITAMGKDRTGIVYKVSRVLAAEKINITDLNSKILGRGSEPVYAMMLEADIPPRLSIDPLQKTFSKLASALKIEITVKPLESLEF